MLKYLSIIALAASLAACATTSDNSTMAAPAAAAAPAPTQVANAELDPNEEICRRVEQTGTRFTSRVCRTRAEWDRMAQEAREATRSMQRETAPPTCVVTNSC